MTDPNLPRGATMADIAKLRDPAANNPEEALRALQEGNARFYSGAQTQIGMTANERRSQIMMQTPFAVVLGCADSRVPIEIVFDQGPGNLFSVRVAGNVADGVALGSLEYAINHLKVHLLVVMGHEGCGAISAALMPDEDRRKESAHIYSLLEQIAPALAQLGNITDNKARMREAVILNVKHQVSRLRENEVVKAAEARGQLSVVGAFYEIGSGAVDFLEY